MTLKLKYRKKIFIVAFLFLMTGLFVYSAPPGGKIPEITVSFSDTSPNVGQRITITVGLDIGIPEDTLPDPGLQLSTMTEIVFGDGGIGSMFGCGTNCEHTVSYTYNTSGPKTIKVDSWNVFGMNSKSITISVNPAPLPICGNSIRETGEGCDDGNVISGDGCDSSCKIENGPALVTVTTPTSQDELNPLKYSKFGELLDKILDVMFWIAIIILPLGIITGGVMFLTASGNPSNIEFGKKVILYCVVILGTIIMFKTLSFIFKDDLTFTK